MSKIKITKTRTTKTAKPTARVLDEETSALVIAEYLAIENVKTREIDTIMDGPKGRGLSNREIAITFRVSEVLGVPVAFEMAPHFRIAFERARALMTALTATEGKQATQSTAVRS